MKFGKYIQAQQADWAGPQFMNYKGLKKIINSVEIPTEPHPTFTTLAAVNPPGVTGLNDEPSQEFQALKTAFFFNLERELEKVNAFYLQKEAEFKVRLRTLIDKKRILQNRQGAHVQVSLANLKEGFLQFQHDLTKLQIFVEVNATGFRKILKKWDKRAKSTTKELYLSRQIEIQPCFNNDVLSDLQDQASANFTELDSVLEEPGAGNMAKSVEAPSRSDAVEDVETELTKALAAKNVGAVKEFLQRRKSVVGSQGVPPDEDESLSRAFFRFCGDSSLECLNLLVGSGEVDINFTDDVNDRSYLHESAVAGRLDVMELCAGLGANIQAVDVYGRQPLHYAAMFGRPDCATFLIGRGAVVDALDHDGCTPLVYSITGGHTSCAQIFIDNGAAVESLSPIAPIPLSLACQHGQKEIVTLLLSKGAKLTANADGLFPLHLTSREGHHEISQLLINHGATVDAKDTLNGWTPIFYTASEGHEECARVLIDAGCQIAVKDDSDWLPWTYALYRGHIAVARLLEVPNGGEEGMQLVKSVVDKGIKPMAPSALFVAEESGDVDMDDIPDLSLPPPIIPFRIYGHAFLDKRFYIQINFSSLTSKDNSPIRLFGSRQLSSLKLIISSKPEVGVPYSVILPLQDDQEVYTFLVEDITQFSLQFDIFPTFGTKPIGRAVCLPSQLGMMMGKSWSGAGLREAVISPLFDPHLRVVGELGFEVAVVKPFIHPSLTIGGKVETYWKSHKVVNTSKGNADTGIHSFITASSLAEEYVEVVVQATKDGQVAVYPDWFLPVEGVNIAVPQIPFAKAQSLFARRKDGSGRAVQGFGRLAQELRKGARLTCEELAGIVYGSLYSLEEVLTTLPAGVGLSIVLKYPTSSERAALELTDVIDLNAFVDAVLQNVYDHANQRSIIFSSFNPSVCTAINWKQPNYGVFFRSRCGFGKVRGDPGMSGNPVHVEESDVRCGSIKEAIHFAKSSNVLGVICEGTPLVQVPLLISTIKESGLILATFGTVNEDPANVKLQEGFGVDGIIANNVFRYNVT